ncbi:MAG: PPOX class probable FMN-dependent enzyme [Parasphingorhabdus sp.]|jgi:PPOX class probable FMN-dependent enzyme
MYLESESELREILGSANGRSVQKQISHLEKHSINFIHHSPFLILSTYAPDGLPDASPRGGSAGFVKIIDDQRIIIPDAKGNNRLDTLDNITKTGQIGCLFLIPGVDETLRINGTARISTAAEYLELFTDERNPPKVCIEITSQEIYLHCAKALMRSKLWDSDLQINRADFPTMGVMLKDHIQSDAPAESQAEMVKRYKEDL